MTGEPGVRRRRALPTPVAAVLSGVLGVVCLGGSLVWVPPAQGAPLEDPLTVTLTSLSPASIPRSGPVVITGRVLNSSTETWSDVRVYPLFSEAPITDRTALAAAARSDPYTTASGSRLTDEGQFVEIARLAPGQSAGFRIRLPRRELPISGAAGVYWVGAQALGTSESARDVLADGRARTFMPLVPRRANAEVSLVAPLRKPVERDVRTRVDDPATVAESFAPEGRLGRLLDVLGGEPDVTWLVDPAVLDVAADLAGDNPAMSLGPDPEEAPTPSPSASASAGPTGNAAPRRSLDETARQQTESWLASTTTTLAAARVLALPYADADALAMLRRDQDLFEQAHALSVDRLKTRGVGAARALAPPSRRVDARLLAGAKESVLVLADAPRASAPPVVLDGAGHDYLLPQPAAVEGGPGPGDPYSALNLRQRILAEAALRATAGIDDPLLVALPDDWDPGALWQQAGFLQALDSEWVDLVPLPSPVAEGAGKPLAALPYTRADRRRELDWPLLRSSSELIRSSTVLANLLDTENDVSLRLRSMAFAGSSYASRGEQDSAASLVETMIDTVSGLTDRVSVIGTEFVTLSGGSGTITVSLLNELPQPVRIGLDVRTRSGGALAFEETEPVTLQAGQRTTMRLQVRTTRLGVNEVTISPVTINDRPIGTPLEVTVRSSEVGRWFWSVMVGAAAVLVVMSAKRIRDRVRTRRWRRADHPDPDGPKLRPEADPETDAEADTGADAEADAEPGPGHAPWTRPEGHRG